MDYSLAFKQITEDMAKTYAAKNHDYGNAFGKSFAEFGVISAAVRMNDKMERIKSLIEMQPGQKRVNESLEDTLLDLANYAVMTLVELRAEQEKGWEAREATQA